MKKNILVVDDEKAILKSFEEILSAAGYDVDTAETAKEAVEKSEKKQYDIALIDIRLQDMDGTQLLRELHEAVPKRMIKIMVTGYANLENTMLSLKMGAAAYITKPVNPVGLLKVIGKMLEERDSEGLGQMGSPQSQASGDEVA